MEEEGKLSINQPKEYVTHGSDSGNAKDKI